LALVFEYSHEKKSAQVTPGCDELHSQIPQLKWENDIFIKMPGDLGYRTKNGNDPTTKYRILDQETV